MKTNQEEKDSNSLMDALATPKFVLAVVVLVVYLLFVGYMLFRTGLDDLIWTRMLFLFTGIETIVFAALGYVFGRDVHRIRAENAEQTIVEEKVEKEKLKIETEVAKENEQIEKEKVIKLATAINALNSQTSEKDTSYTKLHGGPESSTKSATDHSSMSYLVNLANSLSPDISDYTTVSFSYEITPPDKIQSITINNKTKAAPSGSFSGVPIFNNRFSIDVLRHSDFDEWTFKITGVKDSNGASRKQHDGKLISNRDSAYVLLENL